MRVDSHSNTPVTLPMANPGLSFQWSTTLRGILAGCVDPSQILEPLFKPRLLLADKYEPGTYEAAAMIAGNIHHSRSI